MNQSRYKTARDFLLRLVLVYGLLILPWPGLSDAYGTFFRGLVRAVFSTDTGPRELEFKSLKQAHGMSQTRIEIVNRALMARDGSGPVRNLDMDTGGFWRTTALLIGLIVATPISWQRRVYALLWGCLGVHGFILLSTTFCIWNESRHVELIKLSPFWQNVADKIQTVLISQFNLAAPVLIWVLVTFRQGDRIGNFSLSDRFRESAKR